MVPLQQEWAASGPGAILVEQEAGGLLGALDDGQEDEEIILPTSIQEGEEEEDNTDVDFAAVDTTNAADGDNTWAHVLEESHHQHHLIVSTGESEEQIALEALGTLCSIDVGGSCCNLNQDQQRPGLSLEEAKAKLLSKLEEEEEEEDGVTVSAVDSGEESSGKDIMSQISNFFSGGRKIATGAGAAAAAAAGPNKTGPSSHRK